jgi:hypothetical protein
LIHSISKSGADLSAPLFFCDILAVFFPRFHLRPDERPVENGGKVYAPEIVFIFIRRRRFQPGRVGLSAVIAFKGTSGERGRSSV